jgi:hypothetical protein
VISSQRKNYVWKEIESNSRRVVADVYCMTTELRRHIDRDYLFIQSFSTTRMRSNLYETTFHHTWVDDVTIRLLTIRTDGQTDFWRLV